MRSRNFWVQALGLALTVTVAACGGGSEAPKPLDLGAGGGAAPAAPAGGGPAQTIDPATAATVKGVVTITGTAPKNEPIRMNADPVCVKEAKGNVTQETYMVGADGKSIANVFVYVKDGLSGSFPAPTTPAKLDQVGCRYHPHVFGVQVGQPLEILNSDPTLHNIHATPKNNQEFNNGQPIQGMKTTQTFKAKEVMVPFKCDVHGWMNAYVAVLDHPFFAVTDAEGKFEIKGLPAGTYTLEAWHEKLGAVTQSVTVAAKDSKDVNFSLTVGAPAATN